MNPYTYHMLIPTKCADTPFPKGKATPFAWNTFPVTRDAAALLRCNEPIADAREYAFRITAAYDLRTPCRVVLTTPKSTRRIATLRMDYATHLEPFEVALTKKDVAAVADEGVTLRLADDTCDTLWVFTGTSERDRNAPPALTPHIIAANAHATEKTACTMLSSFASISPFNWMEGCVLDGLSTLYEATKNACYDNAIEEHLFAYFNKTSFSYINYINEVREGTIGTIESTLPWATLAKQHPAHPAIDRALSFWRSHMNEDGVIRDEYCLSSEANYTLAYPLAVIGCVRDEKALSSLALTQLRARRDGLFTDKNLLCQRKERGEDVLPGWSRAYAWYLLGLVKTLSYIPSDMDTRDLEDEFRRLASFLVAHLRDDGIWPCIIGDAGITPDTSGSAGIAAALALGIYEGILDESYRVVVEDAYLELSRFLTPDGFLSGVAQVNRGGYELQAGTYRVISQFALGLYGVLAGALSHKGGVA